MKNNNTIINDNMICLHKLLCKNECFDLMGRRKDNIKKYQELAPEKLHTHIRKNISIPKYMDMFLFENNISLSKLVQNAINIRIQESQVQTIKKDVEQNIKEKNIRKKIDEKQKEDPRFKQELQRARLILTQYFNALDLNDLIELDQKKQLILTDFPEMYVDVIRFETWYKKNIDTYHHIKAQYENPVERLIVIKNKYL